MSRQYDELFKADPLFMGKALLPSMFNCDSADFHRTIVKDYLDRKTDRFCYIAPRGHAKSSVIAGLLVLNHIEYGDYDQKVILLVSKTLSHAEGLLDTIKNILAGEDGDGLYAAHFGVRNRHNSRKWGQSRIELADRTVVIAKGTGQQIVGLKKDSQRPTMIVFDDPEDMENTKTAESMEYNLKWLLNSIVPAKDPRGIIMLVGTPQHELCMVETVQKMKGWISRRWQAINGEGWESDYSKGEALWPERHSMEALIREYESTLSVGMVSSFYREFQCVVVGDGDRKFTRNMIRHYKIDKIFNAGGLRFLKGRYYSYDRGEKRYVPGREFQFHITVQAGIDLASTITSRSDYSVNFFWGLTACHKCFILDYDRFRKQPLQAAERLKDKLLKWEPDWVYIEQQGFQVMVRDTLRHNMGINYPGMGQKITYSDKKEDRIFSVLQPHYGAGNVYHPVDEDTNLVKELLMFPRGATDDIIDSASTGMWRIHWPEPGYDNYDENNESYFDENEYEVDAWMTV